MRERMALWPLEAEHYAYVFKEHDHYGLAQREAEMRRIQRLGYDAVCEAVLPGAGTFERSGDSPAKSWADRRHL